MKQVKVVTALNAVTETTTSEAIDVRYAKKITLQLTRANHSFGSSAFTVTGSLDGVTYVGINTIIDNLTNTNVQTLTRIDTKTLSANGSALVAIDLEQFGYSFIKVTVTETIDGTHSAVVLVEY